MHKYIEANVPEELAVRVVYLFPSRPGVSKNKLKKLGRTNTSYVTLCRLLDKDTKEVLAEGRAACSAEDKPNRKIGRAIAVGRALANYIEEQEDFDSMDGLEV